MSTFFLAPIIDREVFFGNPRISGAQISPDGNYISFIKPLNDVMNIWVVARDETLESAIPVSNDKNRPIRSYFWSHDSRFILYEQDKGGDENYRIYAVKPSDAEAGYIPESRDLTPYDDIRAVIVALPKCFENLIYVGINDRDRAWHDYYAINMDTGERSLLLSNTENFNDVCFDLQGKLRLSSRALPDGGNEILQLTDQGFTKVLQSTLEETLNPIRFTKDSNQVYFISNKGDSDLVGLYIFNLDSGEMHLIESDPLNKVDLENVKFSRITDDLIATIYTGDKKRIYWKSPEHESDFQHLLQKFPNTEIDITSTSKDESLWTIFVSNDVDPGAAYLFDRNSKKIDFLFKPRPELESKHLVSMEAVRFPSFDGLEIPAYLSLPKIENPEQLPAVLLVHGGPWARDYWGYNGYAQFLANRGYAVLQINFRGSTGYGKKFLNAAINEWGEKMQDDLSAGARYLIEANIADPGRIAIMGGSYGGYATLAGLAFTPEVYAAGVAIVGPSNLFTLLETIPPYWESARTMFHKRMGNPNTEEGRKQLKRQSPFFHAKNINAPLMVAQGANDPRVKKSESDQIVIAMRDLSLPVEYLNFPDEGHGFANPKNNMAFIASMERFLSKHLGGRYQKEVPDLLQSILDNVSVDISSLTMPQKISASLRHTPLPAVSRKVNTSTNLYKANLTLQDQEFSFDLKRTVEFTDQHISIEDSSESPLGNMSDQITLDPNSLTMKTRKIDQSPLWIEVQASSGKINGEMKMEGHASEIDMNIDVDYISDGPALDTFISSIRMDAGKHTYINILDVQAQSLSLYKLSREDGVVALAGFNTHHLILQSLEGQEKTFHYWVHDTDTSLMVKKEFNIPEMGGAKMTIQWMQQLD